MFQDLPIIPLDEIFRLFAEFQKDTRQNKVNLGIGLCFDEQLQLFQQNTTKTVFSQCNTSDFSYAPIGGFPEYLKLTAELLLKNYVPNERALQASTGGSHALRLIADLIIRDGTYKKLLIGTPWWNNHLALFKQFEIVTFEHLDRIQYRASLQNYITAIEQNPNAVLLLHGGNAHNPTGVNLTKEELLQLIPYIQKHNIYCIVDFAYFGIWESPEEAREWLSVINDNLNEFAITFSNSKNAGLYEMRTGALLVKTDHKDIVESQLRQLCRESVSTSPGIGQEMIINLLTNHKEEWFNELETMRMRIEKVKQLMLPKLSSEYTKLQACTGLFWLLPLSPEQILRLKEEFWIYILSNGRINFTGITEENVDYIVNSLKLVLI